MKQALLLPLLLCNFNCLFAQVNLNQGLVAYYPFSGNANDASGNNNNPVFNNATLTADRLGNVNNAYSFNGIDNYIRIPNSASLNPTNQISICAWVKVNGFYQGKCHGNNIVMKGDADYLTGNYMIRFDDSYITNNQNCFIAAPDVTHETFFGLQATQLANSPYVQLGQWYSVVYTCDGAAAQTYVNCQLVGSGPANGITFSNGYDLLLGRLNDSQYPYWFNGVMDEVRIYNRPLNQAEVNEYGGCVSCSVQSDFSSQQDACDPLSISFLASTPTYNSIEWDFGDGNTSSGSLNAVHSYSGFGNYTVRMIITHDLNCSDTITKTIAVNVQNDTQLILTPDTTICLGQTKKLLTMPGLSFCWSPSTSLDNPTLANPTTSTPQNITYYCTVASTGTNLIVNGDFNAGNTGFTSGYNYANPNVTEGEYFVGTSPQSWNAALSNCGDHTTGSGKMMLVNGSPVPNVNVWKETVPVTPNTNYAFSTWIQALWPPNPAQLQFSINGKDIGTLITASLPTCTLTQFYTTWNSGNNSAATISILNKNTAIQGNDFALDDISFAPVFIKRDSVKILVDAPVVKTSNDTAFCEGGQAQLNTFGANTYSWSPVAGLSSSFIGNPIATPPSTTQYIVAGTTAHGCVAKDTVNIVVFAKPLITKSADALICKNAFVQLSASGGIAYSWSPSTSLSNASIPNPVASPAVNTVYHVTVTSANNCTNSDSVKVNIRPAPVFAVNATKNVCQNNVVQLSASGGNIYSWQPVATLNDASIANPMASPQSTTNYLVQITDTVCNNTSTLTTTVNVFPLPTVQASKSADLDCSNDFSQLTATGATTYVWSPANSLNNAQIANPIARPTVQTLYVVKGIDANGCVAFDSVTVNITAANKTGYYMPSAFTPNNDGVNDCYRIKYWGVIEELDFGIYNRWGERIFHTSNPSECWDGTYKGEKQIPDVYVYLITAKTSCGKVFKKGTFALIR